jgi:hypothetical protein
MRRYVVACGVALLAVLGAAPASAVPPHLHCVENASGNTHSIARGVTLHAPHESAFHNFHGNVHLGAFAGNNPNVISADLTAPFTCPLSP